jgi:hypothetical protein
MFWWKTGIARLELPMVLELSVLSAFIELISARIHDLNC